VVSAISLGELSSRLISFCQNNWILSREEKKSKNILRPPPPPPVGFIKLVKKHLWKLPSWLQEHKNEHVFDSNFEFGSIFDWAIIRRVTIISHSLKLLKLGQTFIFFNF
jgi:hypothetical protein